MLNVLVLYLVGMGGEGILAKGNSTSNSVDAQQNLLHFHAHRVAWPGC